MGSVVVLLPRPPLLPAGPEVDFSHEHHESRDEHTEEVDLVLPPPRAAGAGAVPDVVLARPAAAAKGKAAAAAARAWTCGERVRNRKTGALGRVSADAPASSKLVLVRWDGAMPRAASVDAVELVT